MGPVFVVASPCSGGELATELLAHSPGLEPTGGQSAFLDGFPALELSNRGWDSDRLTGADLDPALAQRVRAALAETVPEEGVRVLDGDGRNGLRIPFLAAVFPSASFVYVHREPTESVPAMLAAWKTGDDATHPDLPGWEGPAWSLPLTPEWRSLAERPLAEIAAEQWAMATRIMLTDLDRLLGPRWCVVERSALLDDPAAELTRVCEFLGVEPPATIPQPEPGPEATEGEIAAIAPLLPPTEDLAARARAWLADSDDDEDSEPATPPDPTDPKTSPLRSVNSANLADILGQLGSSLMITTYQTGKVVCIRRDGSGVNTHFRQFDSPMGIDVRGGRLAIGTRSQIFEYHNVPNLLPKLQPPGKHDACFVPRRSHYTGDVRIHDIAFAGDELWMVATRFSCLATLDDDHSFVPRWRPSFISKLAAEDRCHLNGLCVVDDQVRYVTALGTSDEAGGWRETKADGGVVIDVPSNEIVAGGLSMPHSPRWYRDRLWVLESGEGAIGYVDTDTGKVETVAQLPGFTRGLAFAGPVAFVGLSEVRESATFGGLPLTGRLEERQCGVWVVNIETGETIAFLRFEDLVEELFAVHVLPGVAFPEIAEDGSDAVNLTYVLPDEALQDT